MNPITVIPGLIWDASARELDPSRLVHYEGTGYTGG